MNFIIGRITFIPSKQLVLSIFKEQHSGSLMEVLEKILTDNLEYAPKKKNEGPPFKLGDFIYDDNNKLIAAKMGISHKVKLGRYNKEEQHFSKEQDEDIKQLNIIWDRESQAIIIQKLLSVYDKPERLLKALELHINRYIHGYEVNVFIKPIINEQDFWNSIEKADRVYALEFSLLIPNLFGDTQKPIKELLEISKKENNANEISMGLKNSEGKLNIDKRSNRVKEALDYINKGGGEWKLKLSKGGKTFSRRSREFLSTFVGDIEEFSEKFIKETIKKLRAYYDKENKGE